MQSVLLRNGGLVLCAQQRNFATLKDISLRLKSVSNIQKITKSMKMIAAVKYAKAERDLKPARPYGEGAQAFYEVTEINKAEKKPDHLMILISSDRGLCGAIHSSISRMVRVDMANKEAGKNVKMVVVGDKVRSQLGRQFPDNMLFHVADVGRKPPTFEDASRIAQEILDSGHKFDQGEIYFNWFKSVVAYDTRKMPIYSLDTVKTSDKLGVYDSLDDNVMQSYLEYSLASMIFYAMREGSVSEQSARMTAMDGASKNAGEMIEKLTLQFNRTRQAVITTELIEIISGAASV